MSENYAECLECGAVICPCVYNKIQLKNKKFAELQTENNTLCTQVRKIVEYLNQANEMIQSASAYGVVFGWQKALEIAQSMKQDIEKK